MNQDLSAPALIQLARRYYPASIGIDDPRYTDSEETRRRLALLEAAMKNTGGWSDSYDEWKRLFPGVRYGTYRRFPMRPVTAAR